ncbi:hypothetical protein OT109_03655 [Phycisphaeraceae bacterium D3-23]
MTLRRLVPIAPMLIVVSTGWICVGCETTPSEPFNPYPMNERTSQRTLVEPDLGDPLILYFTPTGGHMAGSEGYWCELRQIYVDIDGSTSEELLARGSASLPEGERIVGVVLISASGVDIFAREPFRMHRQLCYITTRLDPGSSGAVETDPNQYEIDTPYKWRSIEWDVPGYTTFSSGGLEDLDEISFELVDAGFTIEHIDGLHWVLTETQQ